MSKYLQLGLTVLICFLVACGAQPKHNELRIEQTPSLVINGGQIGFIVTIDGLEAFRITEKRSATIPLANGRHLVSIKRGNDIIYSKEVFVQGATKKIINLSE